MELRDRFHETVNFGVLDSGCVLYVDIAEGTRPMRFVSRVGNRGPAHSTALGKAIASQLDDAQVRQILISEGMPQRTPATLTDPEAYMTELHLVRKRGWALDNGEDEVGGRCVAAPICGFFVPAAISLSAPAAQLPLENLEEVISALLSAVSQIRREIVDTARPSMDSEVAAVPTLGETP